MIVISSASVRQKHQFRTGLKEHQKVVSFKKERKICFIRVCACVTNHEIAWENSKLIITNPQYHQRRCLEAWHINSGPLNGDDEWTGCNYCLTMFSFLFVYSHQMGIYFWNPFLQFINMHMTSWLQFQRYVWLSSQSFTQLGFATAYCWRVMLKCLKLWTMPQNCASNYSMSHRDVAKPL